jgi:hypothetical protein
MAYPNGRFDAVGAISSERAPCRRARCAIPRGGRRTGTPGKAYANRTDLNLPAQAATGQQYGQRIQQIAAQRAMPVGRPATDAVPQGGGRSATTSGSAPAAPPAGPLPGGLMPLDAPSQRPGEPVTAGLAVGPGAGPEALGPMRGQSEDVATELRAIYSRFPTDAMRALLQNLDDD